MKSYQPAGAINGKLCLFYSVFFLVCSKMTAVTVKLYSIGVKRGKCGRGLSEFSLLPSKREVGEQDGSFGAAAGMCCPSPASLLASSFIAKWAF